MVEEKVLARQYEEKLTTSRTRTPVSAGRSRRPSCADSAALTASSPEVQRVDRSFQTDARAKPVRPENGVASAASFDLLAGQEHEDVLQVGRTPLALEGMAVRVDAEDRDARPGAAGAQTRLGCLGLDLGEARGRAVDLEHLAAGVLKHEVCRRPAGHALP